MPAALAHTLTLGGVTLVLLASALRCGPSASGSAGAIPPAVVPVPTGGSAGAAPEAAPLPPTRLRMGFVSLSWSSQLPFAIADELGYLRDAGIEIEPPPGRSGGPVLVAILLSGEIDGMISGIEAQLTSIAAGSPARIVGGMSDRSD